MAAGGQRKGSGAMIFVVIVLLLTLIGAATGLTVGNLLPDPVKSGTADNLTLTGKTTSGTNSDSGTGGQPAEPGAAHPNGDGSATSEAEDKHAEDPAEGDEQIDLQAVTAIPFPPVLTTLAEPKGKWIRVEGSILVSNTSQVPPELLAEKSGEQILSYLRTLRLEQIEGPSGLLGLREDLNDMIRILSGGDAKAVLIHGLIVE